MSTFQHGGNVVSQPSFLIKAAAERLAQALADVDEEELVNEFREMRRRGNRATR